MGESDPTGVKAAMAYSARMERASRKAMAAIRKGGGPVSYGESTSHPCPKARLVQAQGRRPLLVGCGMCAKCRRGSA